MQDGFVSGTPVQYQSIIAAAADKYGVPTSILSGLLKEESGFNPNAVSPAGAVGIAQFLPSTAAGRGVNPWDPTSAINGAAKYLSDGYNQFHSWDLALAAYNAGFGAVIQAGNQIPNITETKNYVNNILSMAKQAGFTGISIPNPIQGIQQGISNVINFPTQITNTFGTLDNIVKFFTNSKNWWKIFIIGAGIIIIIEGINLYFFSESEKQLLISTVDKSKKDIGTATKAIGSSSSSNQGAAAAAEEDAAVVAV